MSYGFVLKPSPFSSYIPSFSSNSCLSVSYFVTSNTDSFFKLATKRLDNCEA